MPHFLIAVHADGTETLLTSHATRESAERILGLLCTDAGIVDVRIVAGDTWPTETSPAQPADRPENPPANEGEKPAAGRAASRQTRPAKTSRLTA
jgi:hypothetical protein